MNGLELIKHTVGGGVMTATTTGGSVDLVKNGKIEFENATAINVDKCFDVPVNPGDEPLYDNYLIVMRGIGSVARENYRGRLRLSATDARGSNYVYQQLAANGTNVTAGRPAAQTYGEFSVTGATSLRDGLHIYAYGPALARPTAFRSVSSSAQNNAAIVDHACTHSLSTAYDGFTLFPSSGTMTGSLTIYGFTKQNVV